MELTERLTKIERLIEAKKAENSRLEGSLEPVIKNLNELCGTTDKNKIQEIIQTKEKTCAASKEAIEKELTDIELKLGL